VIINSPETEKALGYAKQLYDNMVPGVVSWNDASNNKAFLAGEIHWTFNGISIYVAATKDPNLKAIADDMDHAYFPVGPIGEPTELHLFYPLMAMTYTKYPQACKALMAFMLEADQFNKWLEESQGFLSHCLKAYDQNPVWTADPKRTVFRDVAWRSRTAGGLGRREGRIDDLQFRAGRHVRELLHRTRGRERGDQDYGASVAADLSLAGTRLLAAPSEQAAPKTVATGC
jgi:multiple sugar transport system substrate-binding protein